MSTDKFKLKGHVFIKKNGNIVRDVDNLIVDVGKVWIATALCNGSDLLSKIKVGTTVDTTDPAAGETELKSLLGSFSFDVVNGTALNKTATYSRVLLAGEATGAITEAGLFTTADTMLSRVIFDVVNKAIGDEYEIVWVISVV